MAIKDVLVPDIGNFDSVDVIEVLVKAGDTIAKDDSLITLESDKASMDIPAPFAGTVKEVKLKVGDKVAQGTLILTLEAVEEQATAAKPAPAPTAPPVVKAVQEHAIPAPTHPAPEAPKPIAPAHKPDPIGASAVTNRPSYFAMKYLLGKGYQVVPINPNLAGGEIQRQRVYASLAEVPNPVDIVDIFRNPAAAHESQACFRYLCAWRAGMCTSSCAARPETSSWHRAAHRANHPISRFPEAFRTISASATTRAS